MTSRGHNPTWQPVSSTDADTTKATDVAGEVSVGAVATRQFATQVGSVGDHWLSKTIRFRQIGELIVCGMGAVFRALDLNSDIEVAITRMRLVRLFTVHKYWYSVQLRD